MEYFENVRLQEIEAAFHFIQTGIYKLINRGRRVLDRDPRELTSVRFFNIHFKPITPNLNSEQLQNIGLLLKVYIRE